VRHPSALHLVALAGADGAAFAAGAFEGSGFFAGGFASGFEVGAGSGGGGGVAGGAATGAGSRGGSAGAGRWRQPRPIAASTAIARQATRIRTPGGRSPILSRRAVPAHGAVGPPPRVVRLGRRSGERPPPTRGSTPVPEEHRHAERASLDQAPRTHASGLLRRRTPMRTRPPRLNEFPGIGVDRLGAAADAAADPAMLRLENLDTDLRPWPGAVEETRRALDDDAANSYLPFDGSARLREAAAAHVSRQSGVAYDWRRACVISAGGLNGILNVLLATISPGDEVVLTDPIYAGLLNRVRLAGGAPRLARLVPGRDGWRLDLDSFRAATASPRVRAVIAMSPSMPTGYVATAEEWAAVAAACVDHDLLLVYDAAMERTLFDGRTVLHPASLPGMAERTVTVGSASKELRMIGWRVGWVVGPEPLVADVSLVGMANAVCQVGIAADGVAAALEAPASDVAAAVTEWQRRRNALLAELRDLAVIPPHGGWSMLLDCEPQGLSGAEASDRLLRSAHVAATPMTGWGSPDAARYLRFVYANEPCERIRGAGERIRRALA